VNETTKELPRYKCHKEVHALKILGIDIDYDKGGATITPDEEGYEPFHVDQAYLNKHNPYVGGYYVVYTEDGYQSFSPPNPFEGGYTRI